MTEWSASCATCGKQLNALRAASVRFSSRQKYYFCSQGHADQFVLPSRRVAQASWDVGKATETWPTDGGAPTGGPSRSMEGSEAFAPEPEWDDDEELESTDEEAGADDAESPEEGHDASDAERPDEGQEDDAQDADGEIAPATEDVKSSPRRVERLAPVPPPQPSGTRRSFLDSSESHSLAALFVLGSAVVSALLEDEAPWTLLASSCLLAILLGLSRRLKAMVDSRAQNYLSEVKRLLAAPGRRVGERVEARLVAPHELRAGEEILVREGEVVAADGAVSAGQAQVSPWPGATGTRRIAVGGRLVAGARVVSGQVHVVCGQTGSERAYAGLLAESGALLEEGVFSSQVARNLSVRAAPLAGVIGALLAHAQGGGYAVTLGVLGSIWGALSTPLPRLLVVAITRAWLVRAAVRGVIYSTEELIDQGGHVTAAVFCARGTVLHGEPEVAEIHAFRGVSETRVLALVAGAESVVHHPIAAAVARAATSRGVAADVCRGHHAAPGQGVNCVSSEGEALVVGSRELLLDQRVSIALAEETLRKLETRGLSALLLAKDEHLVGVLALQDSLRAGARATIQLLLDEGIEPVLLSSESRATTEAVGHALSCEHVRPEVPGKHRALEVRRLRDAGSTVAVVGTIPRDESALSAASVPIVLEGAAVSRRDSPHDHERAIGIASGQVLSSAVALVVARRIRHYGQSALLLGYLPIVFALLCTLAQLAPVYFAPVTGALACLLLVPLAQRWVRRPLFSSPLSE